MPDDRITYDQKIVATVARLKERCRAHIVQVKRRKLNTCLYIVAPGVLNTYKTFVLPLIRMDFPEAHLLSNWFTLEPWASDPYMKVTISLDPKRNTMKTIYQACDGTIFEDQVKAVEHETELFEAWLKGLLSSRLHLPDPPLSKMLRHFNDSPDLSCEADSYYGTSLDRLKASLREYWDDTTSERGD